VKSHLNRIYKKTGVSDRLQLAIFAIKAKKVILNHMSQKKEKILDETKVAALYKPKTFKMQLLKN